MIFKNICSKKTYGKEGQEKTIWLNVGTLRINDDGKTFIELNHMPGITYYVFDQKKKETEQGDRF